MIHQASFGSLIRGGFWGILKATIWKLWKLFYDAVIIPFSTSSFNLKKLDRKEGNYRNLIKKNVLGEMKILLIIVQGLSFGEI